MKFGGVLNLGAMLLLSGCVFYLGSSASPVPASDSSGSSNSCQLNTKQIDFSMTFSLEVPTYLDIGGNKFKLNIGMLDGPPPAAADHSGVTAA